MVERANPPDPHPKKPRLRLPPHHPDSGLRLACQCSVIGDVTVTKYEGLFGQRSDAPAQPPRGGES